MLTCVGNDSRAVQDGAVANTQSVTAEDYVANPKRYKCKMIHVGIEGWTEQERRDYGKPLSNDMIGRLFDTTAEHRQQMELFFIVGRAGWSMDVVRQFVDDCMPAHSGSAPKVCVKCTYFNPCPHTPMSRDPCASVFCDTKQVWRIMAACNRRVRVFPTRSLARIAWRTILRRCTPEQAVALGPEPGWANTPDGLLRYVDKLVKRGLAHLVDRIGWEPCANIKTRTRPHA
jgi:hypothetical protein